MKLSTGLMLGLLTASALLLCSRASQTQFATASNADPFLAIDTYVQSEMDAMRIPGLSLAVVKGDQIVHLRGFGRADPTGRAVTPETPFVLASLGKSMTATAIMQLVESGKVGLDAPVQTYLPWFQLADGEASAQITIRHLLHQTSGIPTNLGLGPLTDTKSRTLDEVVGAMKSMHITHPVGTVYQYSNLNYAVLGAVVEVVAAEPFQQYLEQSVFSPLHMTHTFTAKGAAQQAGLATGYRTWFGFPLPFDRPDLPQTVPYYQVYSSAEDVAHFLTAHLNGGRYGDSAILSPSGVALLHRPTAGTQFGYAMGWIFDRVDGVAMLKHNGVGHGYHADMYILPEERWGVVVLMNASNSFTTVESSSRTALGVVQILLGKSPVHGAPLFRRTYLLIDWASCAVLIALAWRAATLKRWRTRMAAARRWLFWSSVAQAVGLVVAPLVLLTVVPRLPWVDLTLRSILLFVPDLGWLLVAGSLLALAIGITMATAIVQVTAKTGCSAPGQLTKS